MSDSIWNRLGDAFTTFGKAVGHAVQATPAKVAWDLATAPWNDSEEFAGFSNTMKTTFGTHYAGESVKALADASGAVQKVPGVAPVLDKINEINQEFIREPLATAALALTDIKSGKASFFDPNEWKKAYAGAQDISYGQAVTGYIRSWYDPKFNIYDPRERDAAFKDSFWGSAVSGTYDLGIQFFGDVSLVAGKGVKLLKAGELAQTTLKNADVIAKAAEDISKAQYGVKNKYTKVLNDFTNNDSAYALSHPIVKSSTQPGLLAHLLGESKDVENTSLILRSAMGDPAALADLTLKRADMSDALRVARGDLSTVDEFKLFAAPGDSGMIPFMNDNQAVIADAEANYLALVKNDEYFSKLMQLGEGGGSLTRTTGPLVRGFDNLVAESRAMKFYDKNPVVPTVVAFQPTPFHRLYQKVSWAAGERPAGIVNFNDPDSYKEILATINQLDGTSSLRGKAIIPLDATQSKAMLDSYISAATPEARFNAVVKLENAAVRAIAAKYGVEEAVADQLYHTHMGSRMSAMRAINDKGFMVGSDGEILTVQQLESQSADYLPLMDFALLDDVIRRSKGSLNAIAGAGKEVILNVADVTQDLFKAGALLRLGYTTRNAIDSQLRIAASVGALASIRHLGPGIKHIINNSLEVPARMIDRYRAVDSTMKLSDVQTASTTVIKELKTLKTEIAELQAKLSLKPDDIALNGELSTKLLLQEEKQAIYQHYVDVLNRHSGKAGKERIGTGSFSIVTTDGRTFELPDAFGGPLGDMFRRLASSQNSFDRLVDTNGNMFRKLLESKGIQVVRPTDPGYFDQWAQTLRQQFGNSAVAKKLADGEPIEDVARWLANSPEGRDLRRRLGIGSRDAEEYVTRINGFLDQYLPASSGLRNKLREVTAADLRTAFTDPTELPLIHGHLLQEAVMNSSDLNGRALINGLFHFLGTLPEDTWARNPLYIHLYRKEAERRVNIMAEQLGDKFSLADQEKIMSISHKVAQRQMKDILFNIERRSNLSAALKFISPFFSAQENAYKTWMKLAVANPQIVNRAYNVWQAPNRAGLVTDQDGKIVPPGQTSGNDVIWVGLPKGLQKIRGLQSLTEFGIPKQSLDIVFQGGMDVLYNKGNPNVFSDVFPVGPYVAIPVSEIVKKQPNLEDAFKWAIPYGTYKDPLTGLTPAWFQKLETQWQGLDDPQFARTYQLIWNTEQMNAKRSGKSPVSSDKIMQMTKDYWNMRTAANLIMPFAPRFDSPYKFYLDKAREYKRVYGFEADSHFLQDYPDFFDFTTSLSSNPTSIQSSISAVENVKRYGTLVGNLNGIDPKLISLVVNDPKGYDFSQAAYSYLYNKRISPNAKDTFLGSQDPKDAQAKNEANKGWIIFNQFSKAISDELRKRGLSSVQESGAEDLAAIKTAVVDKLSRKVDAKGNPIFDKATGEYEPTAWSLDYKDSDGSKTNKVILGLNSIMTDEKFWAENKNKPMWKSVSIYVDFRKAIAQELAVRPTKNINGKANKDLLQVYDAMVEKLKNDDPTGFGYLYDRFLSQDLIYDKYLTPQQEGKK